MFDIVVIMACLVFQVESKVCKIYQIIFHKILCGLFLINILIANDGQYSILWLKLILKVFWQRYKVEKFDIYLLLYFLKNDKLKKLLVILCVKILERSIFKMNYLFE